MNHKISSKSNFSRLLAIMLLIAATCMVYGQENIPATQPSDASSSSAAKQTNESTAIKDNFRFIVELGGQLRDISGERPSKIEEYGQIRKGVLARRFGVFSNPVGSPNYLRFLGKDVGELDQQYVLEFGRLGVFRTNVRFSGYSHLFARDARSLFTGTGGTLTVDDSIQTTLQGTAPASLPAAVQAIYATSPRIDLKSKRNALDFTQTFNITRAWSVKFNWNRQWRTGNRPMGTGSYERVGTPTGDTFRVMSIELPAPIDSTTDHFTINTRYLKKHWGVSFSYVLSKFDNNIPTLIYDNPFRISDFQATGSGGVFDRMKMARGATSLDPSNHSQSVTLSAFVDLPYRTRLAGAVGWSLWKQNEQFLPYTLNTAVVTGVPAGLNITSTSSLPDQDLNGEVEIFTQDYVIASKPWKNWTFNVRYRRYENDNSTKQIHFPGYVAYVDSYWRTNIAGVPIENEVQSFTRTNTTAEVTWDISKKLRWRVGYEWEGWLREHRQAAKTNENSISTRLTYNPTPRVSSRLSYRYSDRDPGFYNPGVKEFSQLRMFDQARRLRHEADWQWQWALTPQVGVSGTLGFLSDDYDQNFFGLVRYEQWNGSVDLLYIPKDTTTFYLNYSRENYKNALQTISKTAVPFDLNNRWNRDEKDVIDSFGAGLTTYFAKGRAMLDMHYAYSNAVTKITTVNPATPSAISVLNAQAFPFPDVKSRFQELNTDLSYQINDNLALGFRYIYQPYRLDDFALNGLTPYPVNQLPAEQEGVRWLLLDSRYSSHNSHIFGVYFRFGK